MHDVFSDTWNQIVDDLREADLISNAERENLTYMKLPWHESLNEHKIKHMLAPVFVFAGQVRRCILQSISNSEKILLQCPAATQRQELSDKDPSTILGLLLIEYKCLG